MVLVDPRSEVGLQLRRWRERRRLSQLELALAADVSARHLSFVETGRSKPGREMLLRTLAQLNVPPRERNRLLLAAGFAPAYPERRLGEADLDPVREALDTILSGHDPYPAVAMDRNWDMVAANSSMLALTHAVEIDPRLLEPPINVMRLGLHPEGLGQIFVNLGDWHAHWMRKLDRQLADTGDEQLTKLIEEVAAYPVPKPEQDPAADIDAGGMLGPVKVRTPDGELSFFGMFASFDTPFEVTTSELSIELLFPADQNTAAQLRDREFDAGSG